MYLLSRCYQAVYHPSAHSDLRLHETQIVSTSQNLSVQLLFDLWLEGIALMKEGLFLSCIAHLTAITRMIDAAGILDLPPPPPGHGDGIVEGDNTFHIHLLILCHLNLSKCYLQRKRFLILLLIGILFVLPWLGDLMLDYFTRSRLILSSSPILKFGGVIVTHHFFLLLLLLLHLHLLHHPHIQSSPSPYFSPLYPHPVSYMPI